MGEQKHINRPLIVAAVLLALGSVLMWGGMAGAAGRLGTFVITPADHNATLQLPPSPCSSKHPSCTWTLDVFEVLPSGQVLVATATGSSGALTASYPAGYCGEIQVDALVDRASQLRFVVGHRTVVTAASCVPGATTEIPFTALTSTPDGSVVPTSGTAQAQLPFTGIDVRPLMVMGSVLMAAGLAMVSSAGQRRRAVRRALEAAYWLLDG